MKTMFLTALIAVASTAALANTAPQPISASSAAAANTTAAAPETPYTFLLRFPDGSLEICPATGFSIGFPIVNVDVQSCAADKVFGDAFGG